MLGPNLARRSYALLTTFRRNGQPVGTPVWFVTAGDDRVYFMTGPETGKAKRIRNNPRVQVAPSNPRGQAQGAAVDAHARELQGAEAETARQALARKYGIQWTVLGLLSRFRGWHKQTFYEVSEAS